MTHSLPFFVGLCRFCWGTGATNTDMVDNLLSFRSVRRFGKVGDLYEKGT